MLGVMTFPLVEPRTTGARRFGLRIAVTLVIQETLGSAVEGTAVAVGVAARAAVSTGVISFRIRIALHKITYVHCASRHHAAPFLLLF
jgi:hypothetical protein